MRDITEHIDDYCEEHYGHRNWEFMCDDECFGHGEDVAELMLVKILIDPHNRDGDCLCDGGRCMVAKEVSE